MASRFWVGGTGTWDASDTTNWAASSGGAGGQSVPGSGDTVTFDGSSGGGTVTVNHASNTISSLTMGAFTGTLDFATNDNNISMGTFSATGAATKTLNMGDGTWTISAATGALWDLTTAGNLTLNANGSTILISNTAPTAGRTFLGGGKTYNILSVAASTTGIPLNLAGNNTYATFNITAPVNIYFAAGSTHTITNAFTWSGSSSNISALIAGHTNNSGVATIVATGGGTIDWAILAGITFTTGTVNATNSYNLRSMTGITINNPSTGGLIVHPGMNGRLSA